MQALHKKDRITADHMRLFQRKGIWYIEVQHGKKTSLKTRDANLARLVLKDLEKKTLEERLHILNKDELKLLSVFISEYKDFRKDKKPNTQRADSLALQKLLDYYGDRPMVGIKAKVMDQFRAHLFNLTAERSGKKVEANTVNNWIRHLRGALKTAMRWGYMPEYSQGANGKDKKTPTLEPLKVYKVDLRKKIPCTQDDIIRVLLKAEELEPCMVTPMAIQYYCGLGRAEVFAPIWISEGRITYRRQKTGKLKQIKYPEGLKPFIAHLLPGSHKLLPWDTIDTYSDKFTWITTQAGLTGITSHKFRHAFATHLLDKGARLEDVSELMDHSSMDITKRFYGHISQERLDTTINLLDLERKA